MAVGKADCSDTCADAGKGALVDQIASTANEANRARLGVRHARKRSLECCHNFSFHDLFTSCKLSVSTATVKATASAMEAAASVETAKTGLSPESVASGNSSVAEPTEGARTHSLRTVRGDNSMRVEGPAIRIDPAIESGAPLEIVPVHNSPAV